MELEVQLKRSWRLHTRAIVAVREPQSPLCPVGCMRCSLIMRTHEVRSVKSEGGRLCIPKRKCTCIQLMQAFTVCSLLNQPNRSSNLGCATYQLQMQLTFDLKPRLDCLSQRFLIWEKKKWPNCPSNKTDIEMYIACLVLTDAQKIWNTPTST